MQFDRVTVLARDQAPEHVYASNLPKDVLKPLTRNRADIAGMAMDRPQIMGILNVTPDSFSDGGQFTTVETGVAQALAMIKSGASIIDIGGESTRPGADLIAEDEEIARTAPVIEAIRAVSDVPISIDTRKARVAEAAVKAGATLVNDVSGFTFDADLAPFCVDAGLPVCVMHAQGTPQTMQNNPTYDDVRFDVYDFLSERVEMLTKLGVAEDQIIVDPGIGFGKTLDHNLTLLSHLGLFHGLGCPILLGASRKKFIGTLSGADDAQDRIAGSVAANLRAVDQGVQILRVHDVAEMAQALAVWKAIA